MSHRSPRNIVVCCDGTSNQPAKDLTNVAKLTFAMVKDPARQQLFYQPGLGTRAAPGFALPIGSMLARAAGLAFGYGIKNDIIDAYRFIMNHWRPGDRLYLFGFSRGAYTVRALASLIRMFGVTMPGNDSLISYAVNMLWKVDGASPDEAAKAFALARRYRDTLAMAHCPIHFLGVWDTVSSVGWVGSPVALPFTRRNPDIAIIRHAVSIDEHRAFFRTNLFEQLGGQDLKEIWFPGDHCDVAGGYAEGVSGLSKYPLQWMASESRNAGLLIDDQRLAEVLGQTADTHFAKPDPKAPLHDRTPWYWWPAELMPKRHWDRIKRRARFRVNLFRRRRFPPGMQVHPVAWEIADYARRLPAGATCGSLLPRRTGIGTPVRGRSGCKRLPELAITRS